MLIWLSVNLQHFSDGHCTFLVLKNTSRNIYQRLYRLCSVCEPSEEM